MSKMKNELATTSDNALAFAQDVPDYINRGAARGSEEVGSEDMVLPRLDIVQALSPIKEHVEGLKDGTLINSVTQEVFGEHIYFVPVYYRMEYLVWKDQQKGGGFFGAFPSMAAAKARIDEAVQDGENPADIAVVDTPVQYGLKITTDGKTEQLVISMPKTKAKISRKWNAMIQIAGGDRFSRVYKLGTFKDENKQGQKYFNFTVTPAGFTPKAAYMEAERLYEVFKNQEVKVAHESEPEVAFDRGEL